MSDITRILQTIEQGDPHAAGELLPLVYDELRKLAARYLARETPGQTLTPTALVHEAYLRLAPGEKRPGSTPSHWNSRGHFFAAAAEAMRRILVDQARRKQTRKHGGKQARLDVEAEEIPIATCRDPIELLAIHEALERLAQKSPRKAELVKLRYFLGCTMAEAADLLGIAVKTAEEDWTYARAWLRRQLLQDGGETSAI
jgi:RNA polymerase sigma factor (TIGR02999 family)